MGRPKLHKTPEEKVLAARAYRAKYYERHKAEINKKLKAKRVCTAAPAGSLSGKPLGKPSTTTSQEYSVKLLSRR
ncbi:hypothetical protein BV22DRAFT_1135086 [Leucogyrophana mollusca]|uniref:Uncharacterized protein n=1 Tax=Leucogyrophana mollusca TaxID=85980 RepID=A0ACB8AX18_9AGAM|nr:hypothetical protein BV22DRAFT_1135086 [Leucogyrophana mollusca]